MSKKTMFAILFPTFVAVMIIFIIALQAAGVVNIHSSSDSPKSSGCTYKYSDGSICGKKVGSHAPLCDVHFKQLNDTYHEYAD